MVYTYCDIVYAEVEMKVLLVNGSPHKSGCTHTALSVIAEELAACGVGSEEFWIGTAPVAGCTACGGCAKTGACVFNDVVNKLQALARCADGFVFGSPVHYAAAGGAISSVMDRLFYSSSGEGIFRLKPAAAVVSARRGGNTATFDQLNKYFAICEMPIVSSNYWNMVHGKTPDDVMRDEEGVQTMKILARNMAYMLNCKAAAEKAGITPPARESKIATNFIR